MAKVVGKLKGRRDMHKSKGMRVIRVSTGTYNKMAAAPRAAATAPGLRAAVLASRERAAG